MKRKRKWKTVVLAAVLLMVSLLWLEPLLVTVTHSFAPLPAAEQKEDDGISELQKRIEAREKEERGEWEYINISLFPEEFSVEQYREILTKTPVYLRMFWNSVFLTVTIVAGSVVVSLLGAYGFTALSFKGKKFLFYLYIVVMLLPLQVTMMPNYLVADFFGIEDSYLAVILPSVFAPFGVFLLYQQMKLLPKDCMEAARIDGAGNWQIFKSMILPLVKPGIAALIMLLVIENWNLIDQAIIFIKKAEQYPLSVFLARMAAESQGVFDASAVYYVIPVLALLGFGHEYLREGIGLMNVKER